MTQWMTVLTGPNQTQTQTQDLHWHTTEPTEEGILFFPTYVHSVNSDGDFAMRQACAKSRGRYKGY